MKHTKSMVIRETDESRELGLYADNERDIYFSFIVLICKNLARKYKRGTFQKNLAIDAFFPAATAAAKKYCKEYASLEDAPRIFDVTARYTAAAYLLDVHMENIERDNL